jgi:acyl-CoA hydrolase
MAYITCIRTFPGRNFVTRVVKNAAFEVPATLGDVLEYRSEVEQVGTTSVTVRVRLKVHSSCACADGRICFDGKVIMVCVGSDGRPEPVQ